MTLTRDSLLTLEAYAKARKQMRADIIPHRLLRSVRLGEYMNLQFEDEHTIRYQVQEMLRIEKIFEEQGIQDELQTYTPLVPDGHNWKATMLLEYPDVEQRRVALGQLIGVEGKVYVEVAGQPRVYAIADEDLERDNAEKTASVHFLRFEFGPAMMAVMRTGPGIVIGCDHPHYDVRQVIAPATRDALLKDLSAT